MDIEMINLLLIIVPLFLALFAQGAVSYRYKRYLNVSNSCGLSGKEAAEKFLKENGVDYVSITKTSGYLTDHYDPRRQVIRLSSEVYDGRSVASVAIACHEAGHALQHHEDYAFIRFRNFLVKPVEIANKFSWLLIIIGIIFSFSGLFWAGIAMFGVIALFQLVTLPVELNASNRANKFLSNIIYEEEEKSGVRSILRAAAFTYIISLLASLAEMARFILLFVKRDD